jgi:dipeptidyl aminopeptidase/acylaminoacyl peptidase
MLYLERGLSLRARGISLLLVDQPGTGGALRLLGMTDRHDVEHPVASCVTYLEGRTEVDSSRIGVMGLSMGGYCAPRAAAFEKRLACCVVWGAMWELPIPNELYDEESNRTQALYSWKFGVQRQDAYRRLGQLYSLDGIVERISCPILVTHGLHDQAVPVDHAYRVYEAAQNSSRRDIRIFGPEDHTVEHCQMDNIRVGVDYIDDWCAEILVRSNNR